MSDPIIPTNDNIDPPIQDEHTAVVMNAVAQGLNDVFNQGNRGKDAKFGWCLLVFPYDERKMNYISNCDRKQMLRAMMEFISKNKELSETVAKEMSDENILL